MGPINLGDYVLATTYIDEDPNDPWRVGFVCKIVLTRRGVSYVVGEKDGTWTDKREYRHARKITQEEGDEWLQYHKEG
jgi:hypothetical protein